MYQGKKIGVGIVTYNRKDGLLKLFNSLPRECIDELVIVNDGEHFPEYAGLDCHYILNEENLGVGVSKNRALSYLRGRDVDHFFLIEDDVFVKRSDVFFRYIEMSRLTGVQHFNFSQHGKQNMDQQGLPRMRMRCDFGRDKLFMFPSCVGAFSYYTALSLDTVGLMDERFYNALEHVDHTIAIINAGMHPPFGYFADIPDSQDYIGDEGWSVKQSTISGELTFRAIVAVANQYFIQKHGYQTVDITIENTKKVTRILETIHSKYAVNS
ncbi:glycosyltransferase [Enterobacter sp. RHBSTW-00994]|uniref:glycosyltransferase family 2 protein n=1 Tax=Enterobacter sp. RHBSTW-00994 TaxID=2742676 RepID=UPI0015EA79F2|nr:glycosyltransferase [Enterobacter sp. RHBSTW-00994]QLR43733.1 glycosyltransferase [Enterobacter sp. RHBSTW-00994]